MAMNVLYYIFNKRWTDRKIREYLNRKYQKDDIIVIAVHGIFEYYWQSLVRYMKYFDKQGKVVIPISFDYLKPHAKSLIDIEKKIYNIRRKTKAQIVLLGNSAGANILARYMYKTQGRLIREFIPLGISTQTKGAGITFWWFWFFEKTPKEELEFYAKKFYKENIPKTKINIYGKHDLFILNKYRKVKTLKNIGFDSGHFGILYDLNVIKFVYNYIFR
jgi:YD repeat-containing protein